MKQGKRKIFGNYTSTKPQSFAEVKRVQIDLAKKRGDLVAVNRLSHQLRIYNNVMRMV